MLAHLLQLNLAWEDKPANYAAASSLLASARPNPGDFILLPEMFDTGFSFNLPKTADADNATLNVLINLARKHQVTLQGSRTVIGPDGRGRNRASIISPTGDILAEYDKIHPFTFGRESEFFSGGDQVVTFTWSDGRDSLKVCPAICYDLRFPELFRRGLKLGAELFALGANWPAPRALHRRALLQARAIENQAFILGVNRAGRDPHFEYCGGSAAFDPKGEPLGELEDGEAVLSVEIDPKRVHDWRATFPAWKDMRLL